MQLLFFSVALAISLLVSVALTFSALWFVFHDYVKGLTAATVIFISIVGQFAVASLVFGWLAKRLERRVRPQSPKGFLPPHFVYIALAGFFLCLGTWILYLVIDGLAEGQMHVLRSRGPRVLVSAEAQPIAFWYTVLYGLSLGVTMLYGVYWSVRRWQLSNHTVEKDARKSGARPSP